MRRESSKSTGQTSGDTETCGTAEPTTYLQSSYFAGGSGAAGRSSEEVNSRGKWAGRQHGKELKLGPTIDTYTLGWRPTCGCGGDPVPCVVLDPFCGTGTVGLVCGKHGRRFVGIDLSGPYLRDLARKRLGKPQQMALT